MKKLILALFVTTASLLTLTSCTKEYITNSLPGRSYVYDILSNQWSRIENTNTFVYQQSIPDLDKRYFEDGHVSVAISYDDNSTVYEIIPAVIDDYSFSANYSVGRVTIYAEDIGTGGTVQSPKNMITKIVLTDAEIGN